MFIKRNNSQWLSKISNFQEFIPSNRQDRFTQVIVCVNTYSFFGFEEFLPWAQAVLLLCFALLMIGIVVGGHTIFSRVPLDQALLKTKSQMLTSGTITAGSEASIIPLERQSGVWIAYVEFNDLYQTKLVIDTGASLTTISEDLAFDAGIKPDPNRPPINLWTASGKVQAEMGTAPRIRLGNAGRDDVQVVIHTIPNLPEE